MLDRLNIFDRHVRQVRQDRQVGQQQQHHHHQQQQVLLPILIVRWLHELRSLLILFLANDIDEL